jgi:type IV pilus assembly protein PilC
MIVVGEESGNLDKIFEKLTIYYNNENIIKNKISKVLMYPFILIIVSIIIFQFMIFAVLPILASSLSELGGDVPKSTKIIMNLNNIIYENFYLMAVVIGVFSIIVIPILNKPGVKTSLHRFLLNNIILKKFTRMVLAVQFSRVFAILTGSGIQIINSMNIACNTIGNNFARHQINNCINEIKKGNSIAKSITNTNLFPDILCSMIRIGEESGNLEEMLLRVSRILEEELYNSVEKAVSLIEPAVIIGLSGFIGIMLFSMLLPMFNVMNTF